MAGVAGRGKRTASRRREQRRLKEGAAAPFGKRAHVRALSSGSAPPACRAGSRVMGKVYLIGAGPGDPELLTIKAARLLAAANVVLHDSLVSREVLAMISLHAEIIDVGKRAGTKLLTQDEINSLLVANARKHQTVVRLKGGD